MTREEVYTDWLLGEVRRACDDLRILGPAVTDGSWQVQGRRFYEHLAAHSYRRPALDDALAALYEDLLGHPPPPLPSADEVREELLTLPTYDGLYDLADVRALAASDDPADRLMARLIVEVDDA